MGNWYEKNKDRLKAERDAAKLGKIESNENVLSLTNKDVYQTDEEIAKKLELRFEILELMSKAACTGSCRSLIVSGPAGLGKSFQVEQTTTEYADDGGRVKYIKGFMRATALYKSLYECRETGSVIVIDDADSVFFDTDSLNLLKGACDTTETRRIGWGAETKMTDSDGDLLPTSFEFNGSIVFITNYDFDNAIKSGHRLAEHFMALISRSHYIDLEMKSKRDYLVRIKQVIEAGMLKNRGFSDEASTEIVQYVMTNADKLRELSLRVVCKLADLYKSNPKRWEHIASVTMMRPS
jgi:hypothetical protein